MTYQRSIRGREARVPADAPRPLVAEQVWRPAMLPFALAAVAGLASVALPGPALDRSEFLIACAITAGMLVVGLAGAPAPPRPLADRRPAARLPGGRRAAAPRQRRVGQRLPSPRAHTGGLAGRLRHQAPADRRPGGAGRVAARPVRGLRRAALPAERAALRPAVAHGGGPDRPDDAAPACGGPLGPRSPLRPPGRRDRDGDRRSPRVRGADHAVQPRSGADARLPRRRGGRRRVARALPRPHGDRRARRRARRRTRV